MTTVKVAFSGFVLVKSYDFRAFIIASSCGPAISTGPGGILRIGSSTPAAVRASAPDGTRPISDSPRYSTGHAQPSKGNYPAGFWTISDDALQGAGQPTEPHLPQMQGPNGLPRDDACDERDDDGVAARKRADLRSSSVAFSSRIKQVR